MIMTRVAARVLEAGRRRDLLAEVSRKTNAADAFVGPAQLVEQRGRLIGAAVIDVDELEVALAELRCDAHRDADASRGATAPSL